MQWTETVWPCTKAYQSTWAVNRGTARHWECAERHINTHGPGKQTKQTNKKSLPKPTTGGSVSPLSLGR